MKTISLALSVVGMLSGCVPIPTDAGFSDVEALAGARIGAPLRWIRGGAEDAEVAARVQGLLAAPLSVDAAVQIALLNNRTLQAVYEELGASQADLVQAGLLKNPLFSADFRYPAKAPRMMNVEMDLVGNFLDLLFLPARRGKAALEFEGQKLRVSQAVLALASETRSAYTSAVAARQVADLRAVVVEATEASAEFAKRLHEAGNLSELKMTLERDAHELARLERSRAESSAVEAREKLTRLLGLWGEPVKFLIPDRLPDVPAAEIPLGQAERLALTRRLDLQAALREVQSLAAELGLTQRLRWTGEDLELGVGAEREPGGGALAGPAVAFQLPLFDQGQARATRGEARLRQAEHRLSALAVDLRAEVRTLRDRLVRERRRIEHALREILPLRRRAVALQQERYNFMLVGAFELLEAKRREIEAYQDYIETVRDYWITRSEFVHAIGGAVPESKE